MLARCHFFHICSEQTNCQKITDFGTQGQIIIPGHFPSFLFFLPSKSNTKYSWARDSSKDCRKRWTYSHLHPLVTPGQWPLVVTQKPLCKWLCCDRHPCLRVGGGEQANVNGESWCLWLASKLNGAELLFLSQQVCRVDLNFFCPADRRATTRQLGHYSKDIEKVFQLLF